MGSPEQPQGVRALAILAIILGTLGFLGGVFGLVVQAVNPKGGFEQKDPKLKAQSEELQRRLQELQERHRPLIRISLPLGVLASLLLVAGGVSALKVQGRGLVLGSLAINVLVDAFAAALGITMQMQSAKIMRWYFNETASASNLPPAFAGGMWFATLSGVAFALLWVLAKLAFYVWGLIYLGRPQVRAAFSGRTAVMP